MFKGLSVIIRMKSMRGSRSDGEFFAKTVINWSASCPRTIFLDPMSVEGGPKCKPSCLRFCQLPPMLKKI
jgi:hypothetical protein